MRPGALIQIGLFLSSAFSTPAVAERITFAAIGDAPYRPEQERQFGELIQAINERRPAFTVHIGDIKSGRSPCEDALYFRIRGAFNSFDQPLIYTPGDNEWTDCHGTTPPTYDPLERLRRVREVFFPDGDSLGRARLPLKRQSTNADFSTFVENARWSASGVVFATLHLVGSKDGLETNTPEGVAEQRARRAANLSWLAETFAEAERTGAAGVVLFTQANPGWGPEGAKNASVFKDFVDQLTTAVIAYGRPVLVVHGDTHRFRIDKPIADPHSAKGDRLLNFTRLEVFGDTDVHGVLVHIDTDRAGLFSFEPLIVQMRPRP